MSFDSVSSTTNTYVFTNLSSCSNHWIAK